MQLITHLTNIRYLIGFTGTSGFLLLGENQNYFLTDFRYKELAQNLEKGNPRLQFQFLELNNNFDQIEQLIGRESLEFEGNHLSLAELRQWKKRLKEKSFKELKNTIENQRKIKDEDEIENLKKSQVINEKTLDRIKKLLKNGVTEQELAWQIKVIGHDLGADDISFEPIVAFGPHSAIPHHQNTNKKFKLGDVVLMDMGMRYKGYCSDMTRTFFSKKPTLEQSIIYEKVLRAQTAAIAAIKPGIKAAELDHIARKSMGEEAQYFGHSLGHGIGLDVHEGPNLSSRSKDVLKENMVITVEPGIYLSGHFGVRIEDMGRVTKRGYENFTKAEK